MIFDMEELDDNTNDERWFLASDFEKIEETLKKISTGVLFMVAGLCVGGVCFFSNNQENLDNESGDIDTSSYKRMFLYLFSLAYAVIIIDILDLVPSINLDALNAIEHYDSNSFVGAFHAHNAINNDVNSYNVVQHQYDYDPRLIATHKP